MFPKNIKEQHTPQLYTRASVLGGSPEHNVHVRIRNPIAEECENSSGNWGGQDMEEGDGRDFVKTYTVGGKTGQGEGEGRGGRFDRGMVRVIHNWFKMTPPSPRKLKKQQQ